MYLVISGLLAALTLLFSVDTVYEASLLALTPSRQQATKYEIPPHAPNMCLSDSDELVIEALKLNNFIEPNEDVCSLKNDSIPRIRWPWQSAPTGKPTKRAGLPTYCSARQQMESVPGLVISREVNIVNVSNRLGCRPRRSESGSQRKPRAAMCVIVRNEAPQVTEWILHHLLIGIEHVYIFDDCSADNLREVVAPFVSKGLATLLYLKKDYKSQNQKYAYRFCQEHYSHIYDYIGYLDGDEYLTPIKDLCITSTLEHMDVFQAGGISLHTVEMGHENDIVATHHCKVRTNITGTLCTGFNQMAKALCHTQRSHGTTGPHCCKTKTEHPVMYALDEPKAIDQGNDPEMCFSIAEDVRGRWNESWAFIQHRPRMSLYDVVMKTKREKYGVFHDSLMYKKHISIFDMYTGFLGRLGRCQWPPLSSESASIRSGIIHVIHEILIRTDSALRSRCEQIEKRTDNFHSVVAANLGSLLEARNGKTGH